MTLIWATKVKGKWTLLSDNAVTIWQTRTGARESYRPKIREINAKNVQFFVASCGTIKDIDYTLNIVENKLENKKFKSTKEITLFFQDVVSECWRDLKSLTDSPAAAFIVLAPELDALWTIDEYAATKINDDAQIVFGSSDQNFYKANKMEDFFSAFKHTVETDVYCDFPIISVREWDVKEWYLWDKEENFYQYKDPYELEGTPIPVNECYPAYTRELICRDTDTKL